ncbi:hypothetical protein SAMN04488122_3816 [Chitinophaga arvensicola]|uniref:Uncharacterized protein n=1 Tax=Chitinophaga arvensicola TaxID=29529 RepID=A0A1I0S7P1_9BACT|nr:hypothetical protein SAMN04488122_3816 [Chitinophaga arvensicola]
MIRSQMLYSVEL